MGRSDRQSARLISKTSTTKQEMQTSGKILRSTRRSLATDAVSGLARSILHPALWCLKKNETCLWWPFMFGNGFPSRFVHFSFVASLSFRVWPAEVHRITGAGRQSPVRQTELIIGIRDVHSEVSPWTSRTTLRWWTASKTTCSTAQVSVRHLTRSTFTVLRRCWKQCNTASCKMPSRSFWPSNPKSVGTTTTTCDGCACDVCSSNSP